jgi:hypothetical protein
MVAAVERDLLPDASLPARLVVGGHDVGSRAVVTVYPAGS